MIRIPDLKMPLDYSERSLLSAAAKALRTDESNILKIELYKKSVDARKKNDVHFNITLDVKVSGNEKKILNNSRNKKAGIAERYVYTLPKGERTGKRPVVVGAGPAGLFAAMVLSYCGYAPIIVERGKRVDDRTKDVGAFLSEGRLNINSNVQFGEGGAGTFSDGKLTTGIKNPYVRHVLEEFVLCGAPEEILYSSKPHIGTDKLKLTVKNLRERIIEHGGEFCFETRLTDIVIKDGAVTAARCIKSDGTELFFETDSVILAIGHSARDTFEMIYGKGIIIEAKPFSIGARIEHRRELIDKARYGEFAGHPRLGAADYKLSAKTPDGRGVYTFCMCPGGVVIAAASEENTVVTNGMSEFARNAENSNSALLVGVTPEDYGSDSPLAGMYFQREIEKKAFTAGGESYFAPVQRVEDFLLGRKTARLGDVVPSYAPGVATGNLADCLPEFTVQSMRCAIVAMDSMLKGFAMPDAVLTGAETRSSSPIRILRDGSLQSVNVRGLYPCGEGAGYAGGIVSAAVDGMRCAEACIKESGE